MSPFLTRFIYKSYPYIYTFQALEDYHGSYLTQIFNSLQNSILLVHLLAITVTRTVHILKHSGS